VTALQSALAFATIANDGIRIQPHIIKEIRQANGNIVKATQPESERVVSQETARSLRKMMREVVTDGTAKKAQLNGYTSAGKTGTAWKYDAKLGAINQNKYVSSFIGFAPADNPRVVIAVVMDEPQGASRNGGQVAAPVFREIAEQVLPELNVTPDGNLPKELTDDDEIVEDNENPELVDADNDDTETDLTEATKENKSEKVAENLKPKAKRESVISDEEEQKSTKKNGKKGNEIRPKQNKIDKARKNRKT
jgi:membrane peptidoglycan carboxypeptidase